jgi:REP element-mobilizing transposase RayT
MFEPGRPYFITNRTLQGRPFLTPSPLVNNLIGGVLARALKLYNVALYAFHFASNHFHLMASVEHGAVLSDFIGYLESNIARIVGPHLDWRGPFWERRFSAEPILDDDALIGRLSYTIAQGAKDDLVSVAELWPGLTCIPELIHGHKRCFPWYDRSARCEARRRGEPVDDQTFASFETIVLAPLPCWADKSDEERAALAARVLKEANEAASEARGPKPVLGVKAILAQDPLSVPRHVKRSPRPLCHSSTVEGFVAFKRLYRDFVAAFREASAAFRAGMLDVEFPEGSFPPHAPFGWRAQSIAATG